VEEEVMVKKQNKILNSKGKTKTGEKTYKNVEISFYSPEAMKVYVAGEFNGWDTQLLPMNKDKEGVWRSKIKLLPGRHEYKLFADNVWIENLPGAEAILNPFGTQNFIISVK
jgi:1,4-alpha-glucan branching enzyme